MPSVTDDAQPMANLLKAKQPSVLTVALDPEGTGPDTHYKVLLVSVFVVFFACVFVRSGFVYMVVHVVIFALHVWNCMVVQIKQFCLSSILPVVSVISI